MLHGYCFHTWRTSGRIQASRSASHEAPPSLTLLKESVSEMLQTRKIFVLIDGIDETRKLVELGDIIRSICFGGSHLHARVLVTGRKTESLEQIFDDALNFNCMITGKRS
jgi:hypothetical protein